MIIKSKTSTCFLATAASPTLLAKRWKRNTDQTRTLYRNTINSWRFWVILVNKVHPRLVSSKTAKVPVTFMLSKSRQRLSLEMKDSMSSARIWKISCLQCSNSTQTWEYQQLNVWKTNISMTSETPASRLKQFQLSNLTLIEEVYLTMKTLRTTKYRKKSARTP